MADVKDEDLNNIVSTGGGSWWGTFVTAARSKSVEVFEFVKRDLDEISSAVKNEATSVVSTTASAFKETLQLDKPESTVSNMKKSFSSFLGQVSSALSPQPEDGDEEAIIIQGDKPVLLTRLQTRLYSIYNDAETFTKEIEPENEAAYEAWLSNLDDHNLSNDRLTRLLVCNPVLQHNYETLVPHQVTHALFWKRLLFRKALIEDDEAARERREERERHAAEAFRWDQGTWPNQPKEEMLGNHIELSEEEQTRLLQEYEKERNGEIISSKNNKTQQIGEEIVEKIADDKENVGDVKFSIKEKKDLIIVSKDSQNNSSGNSTTSSGDKESNDDDWEREFDLEDTETVEK